MSRGALFRHTPTSPRSRVVGVSGSACFEWCSFMRLSLQVRPHSAVDAPKELHCAPPSGGGGLHAPPASTTGKSHTTLKPVLCEQLKSATAIGSDLELALMTAMHFCR